MSDSQAPFASENLDLKAQLVVAAKVAIGIGAALFVIIEISTFMVWASPLWSEWIIGKP